MSLLFFLLTAGGVALGADVKIEWIVPGGLADFLQDMDAKVGDKLTFEWSGNHNVYVKKNCDGAGAQKWDAFTCPSGAGWNTWTKVEDTSSGLTSSAKYVIPSDLKEGDYVCFACEVGSHCDLGQHTTVLIGKASTNSCAGCLANGMVWIGPRTTGPDTTLKVSEWKCIQDCNNVPDGFACYSDVSGNFQNDEACIRAARDQSCVSFQPNSKNSAEQNCKGCVTTTNAGEPLPSWETDQRKCTWLRESGKCLPAVPKANEIFEDSPWHDVPVARTEEECKDSPAIRSLPGYYTLLLTTAALALGGVSFY